MVQQHSKELVGRLVGIWRYPVKSMGAEPLEKAEVSWFGLAGDRRWAFVRDEARHSGFPWLTIRERTDMHTYQPAFLDLEKPDASAVVVITPQGEEVNLTDPKLATELYPAGARLVKHHRGSFDAFPLSLITTQTVNQLSASVGSPMDIRRFRPNLLIEATADRPFIEDEWVGRVLHIGDLCMRVDQRDGRCVIITVDPETSERNPAVLRNVAKDRQGCLGVYGSVVTPAGITLEDPIYLEGS